MGIKKLFKIKPPEEETPEQNRETLMELGVSTKNPSKKKKEKFAAYGKFAKDKGQDRVYAPPGYEDYAKPQDEEDLNKSELDAVNGDSANGPNGSSADPYSVSSSGADPYAVNLNASYGGDPYSNFQNSNSYSKGGNRGQVHGGYGSERPYAAGDPYGASNSYNSAYDGLNSYNNNGAGSAKSGYGAGSNLNSYNVPNANRPGAANRHGYDEADARYQYSRSHSGSNINSSTDSVPRAGTNNNPYAGNDGYAYSGSGPASKSTTPGLNGNNGGSNPYAAIGSDSYASASASNINPYSRRKTENRSAPARKIREPTDGTKLAPVTSTAGTVDLNQSPLDGDDLNQEPRAGEFDFEESSNLNKIKNTVGVDELDLNATLNEDDRGEDLNAPYAGQDQQQTFQPEPQWQIQEEEEHQSTMGRQQGYGADNNDRGFKTFEDVQREEEARQQQEEDEAVDEVKQEIRFTKQSSIASTRNTLKMAQEAEMAGMNTLGLLGHQSEKLNNVERNLDLMKVQNKIADDKVAELKKLNRSLLAVHVSNPFNSRRRQREREEKIKNRKIEEKLMQEHTSKELARSTQRIEGAMRGNDEISTVRERYQRQQILERAKKYQFENDEEDDMMEVEIDKNLDQIQQISGRLKKLAVATGDELNSQQGRVRNIEDSTDDLDIKIHLNTTRLSGIR